MRSWECHRCLKVNAPWINQCFCGPVIVPVTLPGNMRVKDADRLPDGSFTLYMDDE